MDNNTLEWEPKTIGFIGLGNMGLPMCSNLRRKLPPKVKIYVYDVVEDAMRRLIREHEAHVGSIEACSSAKEVAQASDMVFTIVPEGKHVEQVYLDTHNGILSAAREDIPRFLIDCSTIDTATSLSLAKRISSLSESDLSQPIWFYDAPVSGGTPGAEKATLTFMVGADSSDANAPLLRKYFGLMGKNMFLCGGPSLGLATKLSNNYLSGLIAIATSEAMNLGMRHGVDPKILQQCFSKSSGGNWVNDTVNPVPGVCPESAPSHDYQGGFKVQLMKKDFGLAVQSAKEVNAKMVLGEAGLRAYTEASEDPRCKDRDSRVIYRWLGGKE